MALLFLLGALSALPLTNAHMQMMKPSPFRDPHADRPDEPKDYDILKPLHADGSDFACKGYQWNTPWTTVATYEAGGTYQMELGGSATHGGGSCQLSMSFDGGMEFRVIKSMEGGCPDKKKYNFTVPAELGKAAGDSGARGLFSWTWFNKIGNREMYMNCAVIEVKPKGSRNKERRDNRLERIHARDTTKANAAAQAALSGYPPLFVANLKSINDCITKEVTDVVFDNPGKDVAYADGHTHSASASFGDSKCTGKGSKSAGSSSSSSSPPPPGSSGGSSPGNNGQWQDKDQHQQPQSTSQKSASSKCDNSNGQWQPECYGNPDGQQAISGSTSRVVAQANSAMQAPKQQSVQDLATGKQPSPKVEEQLDAYLSSLYRSSATSKERETAPAQHANDRAVLPKPSAARVAKPIPPKASRKKTKPTPKANEPFPRKHHTSLAHELADVAGEDGPDLDQKAYYDDVRSRQQPRAECRQGATECHSPNRWIKRSNCVWACARKGRFVRRAQEIANIQHENDEEKTMGKIQQQLSDLEILMTTLGDLVANKNEGKMQRRQDRAVEGNATLTAATTENSTPGPATTLELFLGYLSRLKSTVIECIRNIAAASPTVVVAANASIGTSADEAPPVALIDKRQLIIPDVSDFIPAEWQALQGAAEAMFSGIANVPQAAGQGHASTDNGFDWAKVYDLLEDQATERPGTPRPQGLVEISSLPIISQTSAPSTSPSQSLNTVATERPGVPKLVGLSSVSAVAIATESPSPSIPSSQPLNISTTVLNATNPASTTNPLQQAADAETFKDGVFPVLNFDTFLAPSSGATDSEADAAALLPLVLGPGPVIPPSLKIDWPGPNNPGEGNLDKMPKLVNDLLPGSEEEVKKFFDDLKKGTEGEGSGKDAVTTGGITSVGT